MDELRQIEEPAAFDRLLTASHVRPVWIFKHSLSCPISATAMSELRRYAEEAVGDATIGVVPVQRARALARHIEEVTDVRHESPQALLLRGGRVVWHASHWGVTQDALERAQRMAAASGRRGETAALSAAPVCAAGPARR